ncbi:MAG: DNA polymerase III subunit alpha [Selenomonadaceae bacterium]|nr:DNA polymerase III subunit alpha [Selenomonadaceae bacterium]
MPFAHLHVHTEYSLLDGAGRIKELVAAAKAQGMDALAITDHGVMYGVIDFYKEAKKQGIHPVIGCEVYLAPDDRRKKTEVAGVRYYHLILLAENQVGYRNLVKLVSLGNIEGFYYKPRVDKDLLRKYHEGLIALSACVAGEIPHALIAGDNAGAEKLVEEYIDIFGRDNFFLEIQRHHLAEEDKANPGLMALAQKYNLGLVATNDAHYIKREDSGFHDVLLCIQTGKTIDEPGRMRFNSDDYYLKSPAEMAALFPDAPEALANTALIARRCQVDFEFGKLKLPYYPIPSPYANDTAYLRALCEERIGERYPQADKTVRERLDYELDVIKRMGYDSYFLIVWDFINYAKEQGIAVGPGRGSAAGSIVAYALGITDIDPLAYNLLFERFLNPERVTMPDIDVDFCYIRREEVIDYVKRRYGDDHVAQIITFGTMAAKGALRDVGRVLNMSYAEVDRVAKLVPNELKMTLDKALKEATEFRRAYESDDNIKRLIDMAKQVEGLPRHSSTHAAGVVIARDPLTDYLPVQISEGTLVTEYDKDHVEELGLLKMDFLGLRTLTVISDALANIKLSRGETIDITKIPLKDEQTAKMLREGQTSAVFQMESAGMTNLVKDLQPEGFTDLIPTVALYRPGPLGSGMVTDFIRGRNGTKEVTYLHPLLEPILKETFGVVLYQEQVMQIVQVLAGFTLGQADLLRRAMGKKKQEILLAQKENFLHGCQKNGVEAKTAATIFDLLTHFADYGFNKSHSAAYALVAWQTAYLKAHYPAEFMAAMLTSIVETQKLTGYIDECHRMGIKILPPDINASQANFSVDGAAIRFGLGAVKNVGEAAVENIMAVRQSDGAFASLADFCRRVDGRLVNKRVVENLIKCGAFDNFQARRSQMLAVLDEVMGEAASYQREAESDQMGLFALDTISSATERQLPDIPEISPKERLTWEKEFLGFYVTGHPLDSYKEKMPFFTVISALAEFQDKQRAQVAGIVTEVKRITTKKGDTMCFLTVEDYTASLEVTVFPRTFYEAVSFLTVDTPLAIEGRLDVAEDGVKLLAEKIGLLAAYAPNYYVTIKPELAKAAVYDSMREVFARHHGDSPLYLRIKGDWKKSQPEYWLDGSPNSVTELEKILGSGAVTLK